MHAHVTRFLLGGTGVALLATVASVAPTPQPARARDASAASKPAPRDALAFDMAYQAERLHARLNTALPQTAIRNPFEFGRREPPPVAAAPAKQHTERVETPPVAAVVPEWMPPFSLAGIAESAGQPDVTRTAIISAARDVYLVGSGDVIAGRYRVDGIGADAVRLTDLTEGRAFVLTLKSLPSRP